ncbi:UDP-glucuronosyl/UDP-glucosyltransferase [Colletotrichum tofieldiae]|nr:UDP-glucuronosyl/UDP-glucosyltransferase [Colletotrichum tofieldiae]GKT81477.1 UDP-glucuronosyl/UDP-glucosyltransferase [Colletotrichum tofieldiae]
MLPFSNQRRHSQDHAGEPDPESSQLIPTRKRRHRVRVQGRLAVVRSVSTVNLRPAASVAPTLPSPVAASGTTTLATPKFESGVAGSTGTPVRRRKSLDEASSDTEEDDAKETAVRDRQFRGYGIGGAGNISGFFLSWRRTTLTIPGTGRPTEVYGSTKSSSSSSRFAMFHPSGSSDETDKRQWSFKELFARNGERKGKGVAGSGPWH